MKKMKFRVPYYDFDVVLVQIEGKEDADEFIRVCKWMNLEKKEIDEMRDAILSEAQNGGDTWRNFDKKKFLIDFTPFESEEKKIDIYCHEKRHLEDRILEWASINDIEAAAFLAGFLGIQFYKFY